jgi:hypothetical protein
LLRVSKYSRILLTRAWSFIASVGWSLLVAAGEQEEIANLNEEHAREDPTAHAEINVILPARPKLYRAKGQPDEKFCFFAHVLARCVRRQL